MGHLILQGDNTQWRGFSLLGESSLAITMVETGTGVSPVNVLPFLVLSGTTSVSVDSTGVGGGGFNHLGQLAEDNNVLTTVTISGSQPFLLGQEAGGANSSDGVVTDIAAKPAVPTTIHSSLTLIDASATTGGVDIFAGATNTSGAGNFNNGASLNANVTINITGSRSRAARASAISSRTTPRTVLSPMATAMAIKPSWAEPVPRPPWAPAPTTWLLSGLATLGPMRQRVAP